MWRLTSSVALLLVTGGLWAQSSSVDKTEKEAIERAKTILVSSLDRSLPKITLAYFLIYESNGAAIHWEANDCGEQTGDPAAARGSDFPLCVEADFDVEHRAGSIMIAMKTTGKGVKGTPALFSVTITDVNGAVHSIK